MARSPTLTADGAAMGKCGGVSGDAAARWMIRVVEVYLLSLGIEAGEMEAT
jgi:hypothetical protein